MKRKEYSVRGRDTERAHQIVSALRSFRSSERPLPGIETPESEAAFVEQLLESIRRVRYISVISDRDISSSRADPSSPLFDPIKAAVHYHRAQDLDEACWLVFLSVHFGRHVRDCWRLCAAVYGGLGGRRWDWPTISRNPGSFQKWLGDSESKLNGLRFGNHRKYESLQAASPNGTAAVIASYVKWVDAKRGHEGMLNDCRKAVGNDPKLMFDHLYHSMDAVARFGRTARFDYLTMLGKLQLAPVEPGVPYMNGARAL